MIYSGQKTLAKNLRPFVDNAICVNLRNLCLEPSKKYYFCNVELCKKKVIFALHWTD